MAKNDFLNEGDQISGTDISIQPGASGGTRFLSSFVQGLMQGGGSEDRMKKEKEKLSYYTELREAGYSAEEASARVNKQFGGGFLNKILNKDSAGFQAPSAKTDTFSTKSEKTRAELEKTKAEAGWYKRRTGSPSGTGGSGDTQRIKTLQEMIPKLTRNLEKAKDAGAKTKIQAQLDKYQMTLDKLLTTSGTGGGGDQGYVSGETKVGDEFTHTDGKRYRVTGIEDPDDPDVEEVE